MGDAHRTHTVFQHIWASILLLAYCTDNTMSLSVFSLAANTSHVKTNQHTEIDISITVQLLLKYFASLSKITVLRSLGELKALLIEYCLYSVRQEVLKDTKGLHC